MNRTLISLALELGSGNHTWRSPLGAFPQTKVERESGGVTVVSSPLKEPLSQNLFPIEFSRNCLPDTEKWESCSGSNSRFRDHAHTD